MRAYANPTLDRAIGTVDKEWKEMTRLAINLREGRISSREAEEFEKKFTGIFKTLLEKPIEELKKETGDERL